jgi:hypothetical protein
MATDETERQLPVADLVDAAERIRLTEVVALACGGLADPADVDIVVDWVGGARFEYSLTEQVLDGSLLVWVEDGGLRFRGRTPLNTPVQ